MKNNTVIDDLMNNPKVKNIGLKRETIVSLLKAYEEVAFNSLLDNGRIELGNGMSIEVIQLLERVHVLRGNTYKSSRKYKLKLTMNDEVYKRIEAYYNKLKEEIS